MNRQAGAGGYCGLDADAYWFRELIHYGLEFDVVPAHTLYMAGCNMRCVFCTARQWNEQPRAARPWDRQFMRALAQERRDQGAGTLFFVGGEPTASLPAVLDLLSLLGPGYRVAWDSNMYFSAETRELLSGVVDIYVADFKFGNDDCAQRIADAPDYVTTVAENLRFAEQTASLIVRHLLLPGHLECCFLPILQQLRRVLRTPRLAVRGEYLPPRHALTDATLSRYVEGGEIARAASLTVQAGIEIVE